MHPLSTQIDFREAQARQGAQNMARKIFYARRSKRPFVVAFGLMCLGAVVFCAGFEAGRTHPDLLALTKTVAHVNVVLAER